VYLRANFPNFAREFSIGALRKTDISRADVTASFAGHRHSLVNVHAVEVLREFVSSGNSGAFGPRVMGYYVSFAVS